MKYELDFSARSVADQEIIVNSFAAVGAFIGKVTAKALLYFLAKISPRISPPPGKEYVSSGEAARILNVSRQTVKNLAARGEIPHRKIGEQWQFKVVDLYEYEEKKNGESLG